MPSFRASAAQLRCDVRCASEMGCSAPLSMSSDSAVAKHGFWSSITNSPTRWAAARLCEISGCTARPTMRWPLSKTSDASSSSGASRDALADALERARAVPVMVERHTISDSWRALGRGESRPGAGEMRGAVDFDDGLSSSSASRGGLADTVDRAMAASRCHGGFAVPWRLRGAMAASRCHRAVAVPVADERGELDACCVLVEHHEVGYERWDTRGGIREVGYERWDTRGGIREVGYERWDSGVSRGGIREWRRSRVSGECRCVGRSRGCC